MQGALKRESELDSKHGSNANAHPAATMQSMILVTETTHWKRTNRLAAAHAVTSADWWTAGLVSVQWLASSIASRLTTGRLDESSPAIDCVCDIFTGGDESPAYRDSLLPGHATFSRTTTVIVQRPAGRQFCSGSSPTETILLAEVTICEWLRTI